MTEHQLSVLATYRTHKDCKCPDCCEAKTILREMDTEGCCAKWARNNDHKV